MELLFVALGGALIGLVARYALPNRGTQGAVLVPAIGTGVAALIWVALTWLGMKWDGGWIWWITFALTAVIAVAANIVVARRRAHSDNQRLHSLLRSAAPHTS
ncbi:hypothetical protein [Glaciibacter psychrotolerans]|uniref:ABC-type branched-subunit amino acid transport system permease subunit n=1 Tax=Glaciibacter psychrotolerans TaxID=670054 RepID=A0A7Z0J609_9MICO|nr:hypothetical protein [Leifsonia psychrotolerans]NYJ19716.1 ABC-type branched-subunit amino acid transport system permease subunit [Leifsonia psychrotolerans]